MPIGTLFLIPVPLSEDAAAGSYTPFLVDTINELSEYIVENEKTARKFLKQAGLKRPQSELLIHDYGKHVRDKIDTADFFTGLMAGKDVGLMSEAGCPGVADPGAGIVAEAHRRGIKVVPLVGPSSILLALMASGFSGQSFTFHGYLPIDKKELVHSINALENASKRDRSTQIFMETPFRNQKMLENLLQHLHPETLLCIAKNITATDELIQTKRVQDWKKNLPDLHKIPTVFLLSAF